MKPIAVALLLMLTGCVSFNRSGTAYHVILGFGIVAVNNTNAVAANVVKTQALGVSLSSDAGTHFNIGYSSTDTVAVKTNQNLLIEVSDLPGKPLKVSVP